jgi:hypothetical protein
MNAYMSLLRSSRDLSDRVLKHPAPLALMAEYSKTDCQPALPLIADSNYATRPFLVANHSMP